MSFSSIKIKDHVQVALLERSSIYELLSLAFKVSSEAELDFVKVLLSDLPGSKTAQEMFWAGASSKAGSSSSPSELAREFSNLNIEGINNIASTLFHNNELVSLRETSYESNEFAKTRVLADLAGFYKAWSLEISEGTTETPDSISAELEFMCLLLRREVFASAKNMPEQAETTRQAEAAFMEEHLGRFYRSFCLDIVKSCEERSIGANEPGFLEPIVNDEDLIEEVSGEAGLDDKSADQAELDRSDLDRSGWQQTGWQKTSRFYSFIAEFARAFLDSEVQRLQVLPEQLVRRRTALQDDQMDCISP